MDLKQIYGWLANLRVARFLTLAVVYALGSVVGLWLCLQLRFDFNPPLDVVHWMGRVLLVAVALKLGLLYAFGQFEDSLSYFSTPDLGRVAGVCSCFTGFLVFGRLLPGGEALPPLSVSIMEGVVSCAFLCSTRLGIRFFREHLLAPQVRPVARVRRVGIFGAGDTGTALARDLLAKGWLGLRPVAFFDDHRRPGTRVHGIGVLGAPEAVLEASVVAKLDEVVIAMPTAVGARMREMVALLQKVGIPFRTIPSISQLVTGKVGVSQIRPVQIEDLLGRDVVAVGHDNVRAMLAGACVLVTGAGGSIGSELCRQIAGFAPRNLLMVERSEAALFVVEQELVGCGLGAGVVPLVADILDEQRMAEIFKRYRPTLVFHAAAHKHVPMMELQPAEAVRNNVFGTAEVARLSAVWGVERFVLISSDKAINPTNVMGATKRLAEKVLQSLQKRMAGRTRFVAVRFGNVLGSSGSVVPIFARQIAAGGPVTVTHPEVTRYFMTIPEAVSLVLQSAARAQGGEIFVLDMGNPVRIADLARQMVELSGLRPGADVEIVFTGLRPGEKLYEELSHRSEEVMPTDHPKILKMIVGGACNERVRPLLESLSAALGVVQPDEVKALLKRLVPEYTPQYSPQFPTRAEEPSAQVGDERAGRESSGVSK
jgi:FlaA1/EpsC-like NDP-sugar epimerase